MTSASFILTLTAFLLPTLSEASPAKPVTPKAKSAQTVRKNLLLEIHGRIYPKDTFPAQCGEMLKGVKCEIDSFGHYQVETVQEEDVVHNKAVFSSPEGPQVLEESWERDGRVLRARIENRALGKTSELVIKDGKVHYKTTTQDGEVDTSVDDHEENLVVPSTVMSYIRPHFEKIQAGEKIRLKVAVLDRQESFTFYIKKIRSEKSPKGEEISVLEMYPGSIIVRALVSPMYFYIYPKTGEMFAFEGRSALRRKEGDKYKELDVKAAYDYKVNAYNRLNQASARHDTAQSSSCGPGEVLGAGQAAQCEVKSQ